MKKEKKGTETKQEARGEYKGARFIGVSEVMTEKFGLLKPQEINSKIAEADALANRSLFVAVYSDDKGE
jgi:hypothetical protein